MVTGRVKFFDLLRGFGFIVPDDGGADVFVHASAVERSDLGQLAPGDHLSYEVERGRGGGRMSAVDLVLIERAGPQSGEARPRAVDHRYPSVTRPSRFAGADQPVGGSGTGSVKWFDEAKGFGFIVPDQGGADLFVHVSALRSARLDSLREGERVAYEVEFDERRGRASATNLKVLSQGD